MIPKAELLKLFKREFATTQRVMRAFPQDKPDFAPHERSQTARRLMSTFVFEMSAIGSRISGGAFDPSSYAPDDLQTVITDFEKGSAEVVSGLEALSEAEMQKPVEFAGRQFSAGEFMLTMLCDQIHHRGQLSVYVRLAGGKVPSIYGPSADEPGGRP